MTADRNELVKISGIVQNEDTVNVREVTRIYGKRANHNELCREKIYIMACEPRKYKKTCLARRVSQASSEGREGSDKPTQIPQICWFYSLWGMRLYSSFWSRLINDLKIKWNVICWQHMNVFLLNFPVLDCTTRYGKCHRYRMLLRIFCMQTSVACRPYIFFYWFYFVYTLRAEIRSNMFCNLVLLWFKLWYDYIVNQQQIHVQCRPVGSYAGCH